MPEKIIGGNRFEVFPLDAMQSFTLQPRIAPIIAEVGALVLAALQSDAAQQLVGGGTDLKTMSIEQFLALDLDVGVLAEQLVVAVGRICQKLPPADLKAILRELLANAKMDGQALFTQNGDPFLQLMRGRTLDTWRLLFFSVQVNYPDVFSRRAATGGATPAAVSASVASTT